MAARQQGRSRGMLVPHVGVLAKKRTRTYARTHTRAQARFASLFATPLPAGARLRAFARCPDQFALAEYVHACVEDRHNAKET